MMFKNIKTIFIVNFIKFIEAVSLYELLIFTKTNYLKIVYNNTLYFKID